MSKLFNNLNQEQYVVTVAALFNLEGDIRRTLMEELRKEGNTTDNSDKIDRMSSQLAVCNALITDAKSYV